MTERENQLLDIAEKIIWLNQDLKPALTGSLMLALRGIEKPREANDIDIICEYLCETDGGLPLMPQGFKIINMNGRKSQVDAIAFENKELGIKVDFMQSNEEIETTEFGIPCGQVKYMIEAKRSYTKNDLSEESRAKHLNDLTFLCP